MFLNDIHCNEKIISWQDFLKLLDVDRVHIASQKTVYAKDDPIFCTARTCFRSSSEVESSNTLHQKEPRLTALVKTVGVADISRNLWSVKVFENDKA